MITLSFVSTKCYESKSQTPEYAVYVGSTSCKSCHNKEYYQWQTSHHYHAMELPSTASVRGDFSGVSYTADGDSSFFYQVNGEYFVNYTSNKGSTDTFKIAYTFGWEPLQQFLVSTERGKIQTLRTSWDTEKEQWFHQYKGDTIAPETYLHWTGQSMTWNTMCADCHSTNVHKNYHPETDSFHTTYSEVTVGCEGCHGPASVHVNAAEKGESVTATLRLTPGLSNIDQVNQCASCHMRRAVMGDSHMLQDFWNAYLPQTISNTFYHADGQILEEDYVWGSFVQSKMYHEGVKCTDCHNPHTNAVKFEGNKLCLQCHETTYDSLEHHHHELATNAAQCINCHMTGKHYMGNDFRRDHSFRIPRPDLSVDSEIPNACNGCHTEQSAQWASSQLESWYGAPKENYVDALADYASNSDETSYQNLVGLLSADSIPLIARATALEYALQYPSDELLTLLNNQLNDKEAFIRIQALEALNNAPKELRKKHGLVAMNDSLQPVRSIAALITADLTANEMTPAQWSRWQTVQNEYKAHLDYQADFREGRMALAQYAVRQQRWNDAIANYKQALRFDPENTQAYSGWATALAQSNQLNDSYVLLKKAAVKFPQDVRIQFLTGITAYELGEILVATKHLETAVALSDYYPQYVQNLVLIYVETGLVEQANQLVQTAQQKHPQDQQLANLNTYLQQVGSNFSQ